MTGRHHFSRGSFSFFRVCLNSQWIWIPQQKWFPQFGLPHFQWTKNHQSFWPLVLACPHRSLCPEDSRKTKLRYFHHSEGFGPVEKLEPILSNDFNVNCRQLNQMKLITTFVRLSLLRSFWTTNTFQLSTSDPRHEECSGKVVNPPVVRNAPWQQGIGWFFLMGDKRKLTICAWFPLTKKSLNRLVALLNHQRSKPSQSQSNLKIIPPKKRGTTPPKYHGEYNTFYIPSQEILYNNSYW